MRLLWFCIPAHGHTNPTLEVVRELVRRGHEVRYYSFEEFRQKIEDTGAAFIACDAYLTPLDRESERRMRRVSTTEMSVRAFEMTAAMDGMLADEIAQFRPDLVVSDSACFWGKLTAAKHKLPLVCSTTTFAFNQASARYMQTSLREAADMLLGMPRVTRAMQALRPLGYEVKSPLDIVQNKNDTDTIVYTSESFQPCAESFDKAHYRFVGPSVRAVEPAEKRGRPLVYVSLGTVINDRPDFYRRCIEASRAQAWDMLISCGRAFDAASLGELPENVRAENYVNQMEVLARASLFVTHCGMNSASEGMYMGVPELLYPLTGEQRAVARRVEEMGAGRRLSEREAGSALHLRTAISCALADEGLRLAALRMREDFLACPGAKGAADFIEEVGRA
ncbi:MAG: glycosyl transferase [Oscillospiraceae bacterium]|nr:glycosyl transferase [Oscillospiraceae bacterium]